MTRLTRAQILNSFPATEDVPVPEWGDPAGVVTVTALNGPRRLAYAKAQWGEDGKLKDGDRQDAILVVFSVVDADGELLFTVDDVETLWQKSSAAMDRVFKVATRLSGYGRDAVDDAKKN
jgi:hypothetical protein